MTSGYKRLQAELKKARAHAETLSAFNSRQLDWRVTCRKCGKVRVGSLAQIKAPCNCAEVVSTQESPLEGQNGP